MSSSWAEGLGDSGMRGEESHVSRSHLQRVHAEVCWLPVVELSIKHPSALVFCFITWNVVITMPVQLPSQIGVRNQRRGEIRREVAGSAAQHSVTICGC